MLIRGHPYISLLSGNDNRSAKSPYQLLVKSRAFLKNNGYFSDNNESAQSSHVV